MAIVSICARRWLANLLCELGLSQTAKRLVPELLPLLEKSDDCLQPARRLQLSLAQPCQFLLCGMPAPLPHRLTTAKDVYNAGATKLVRWKFLNIEMVDSTPWQRDGGRRSNRRCFPHVGSARLRIIFQELAYGRFSTDLSNRYNRSEGH
jgi:hypothetical protein